VSPALTLAFALLASAPEPTTPASTDSARGGDEFKTVVRPRDTTPPTAVLDRARLEETAGRDLATLLDDEPGMDVTRLGGLGAFATLSIRGSSPEQVLLALDGIPLNPADGAPVDLSTLPLGPLDHVDLYRGRSPWALGVTGLGGAVLLHSRRAPERVAADAELATGSFGTGVLRAWVGGGGLSLAIDGLTTRSNFRFTNDQGTAWTTEDDRLVTRANADSSSATILARAELDLDPGRLTLLDAWTTVDRGLPGLGVNPTRESRFSMERHLLALRLDLEPAPFRLAITTWLAATETEVTDPLGEIGLGSGNSTVASFVPGAVATLALPLAPADAWRLTPTLHIAWRHEATSGSALASASRHLLSGAVEFLSRHRLSEDTGLELGAGLRLEAALGGALDNAPSDTDAAATSLGAFLEAAWRASPSLRVTLGARLAPRLPSLFERFGDTGLVLGNPTLRPESAMTVETGLRWDAPLDSHRLSVAALAYATLAEDLIQFVQNSQGVSRPENLASARILGLELEVQAELFEHLRLRSSLTILDAIDTSDIAARSGNHLPLRPTFASSHRLDLVLADTALGEARGQIGAYVSLDWIGQNHLDFANLVAVPARLLLGGGLYVRSDLAEVMLSLSNLTDDRIQDLAGYPLPGFTAMCSLRLRSTP
jgi:iron complex outermembrane receptor protein